MSLLDLHTIELSGVLAYAGALAVAAVIPGPGVIALLGRALATGRRSAMWFIAGIALGDIIYLALAIAGLALLAQTFTEAFFVVRLLAAAYLLYLAWAFWTARAALDWRQSDAPASSGWATLLSGTAVTLSNPKAMAFYVALAPLVLDFDTVTPIHFAVLAVVTTGILVAVLVPYALAADRIRGWMLSDPGTAETAAGWINKGAAAVMAAAAGWVAVKV